MKLRCVDIFILITGVFFLCVAPAMALADEERYLWIEMENAERLKDGGLNLRINLFYGSYPDEKAPADEIQELKAFYIKKSFTKTAAEESFKADINISAGKYFINIKSPDENRYTLYVSGIMDIGPEKHYLYAKTTFALFGKSSSKNYNELRADLEKINRQFEIFAVPEFHYWPQTGYPIKISELFNGAPSTITNICVYNEHNPMENILCDSNGKITYVPPDDNELNQKSSTAFKHTIVTAVHSEAGEKYISSRTFILHRSRYGNYRLNMGVIIFGITILSFFMFMCFVRKRSAF